MTDAHGEMIVYWNQKGGSAVQLKAVDGTVWLSQRALADLYATSVPNINQIITRVLADGEVTEATINSELIVRSEGNREVRRTLTVYNLDMILAVGYRVTTSQAVMFRQWATTVLKEYLTKGFVLDDERLKNPGAEPDYFDEVVKRIRSIRASEKRFYQKVRDLFASTSSDYDSSTQTAKDFFATIQNKLLFAITGHTAAELVRLRIDPASTTFGLTTWQGDRPLKADAIVAKNYLTGDELRRLDRLTTQFLDFAEDQAERRIATTMEQWVAVTDGMLRGFNLQRLEGRGRTSHESVEALVDQQWPGFAEERRLRDRATALEVEAADITELLAIERIRVEGDHDGDTN
ncbi:MAG: virulence RhuM family protein [Propionibacteriaceae bacterium]|jgi:hypothetical protein|nr:virulence RhuM family protein [Propionibacteriaceae bacterium]